MGLATPGPSYKFKPILRSPSPHYDLHLASRLSRRLDRDLHVLSERGQEFHQPSDREIAGAVAHQQGDVRLLDAEDGAGLRLRQPARFDDFIDLQRQPCLEQFLLRIRQAEIGKDIAAAFPCACSCLLDHVSSAFPCDVAPLPYSAV
jgi:hypothetical protein